VYALGLCFGFMLWVYALGLCFGFMLWVYALGLCFGFMLWVYALGLRFGFTFWNYALDYILKSRPGIMTWNLSWNHAPVCPLHITERLPIIKKIPIYPSTPNMFHVKSSVYLY
ncbi:hypothetical protein, partial [Paenibacillus sp. GCM10012303]|uniref:hypothetical protein n=1 Tax=Paenibacillus sp. GCM10012303 TaxID=3317340 RepID=UPI0036081223